MPPRPWERTVPQHRDRRLRVTEFTGSGDEPRRLRIEFDTEQSAGGVVSPADGTHPMRITPVTRPEGTAARASAEDDALARATGLLKPWRAADGG